MYKVAFHDPRAHIVVCVDAILILGMRGVGMDSRKSGNQLESYHTCKHLLVEDFAEPFDSALGSLNFHLLDYVVEDIIRFGC